MAYIRRLVGGGAAKLLVQVVATLFTVGWSVGLRILANKTKKVLNLMAPSESTD